MERREDMRKMRGRKAKGRKAGKRMRRRAVVLCCRDCLLARSATYVQACTGGPSLSDLPLHPGGGTPSPKGKNFFPSEGGLAEGAP